MDTEAHDQRVIEILEAELSAALERIAQLEEAFKTIIEIHDRPYSDWDNENSTEAELGRYRAVVDRAREALRGGA